MIFPIGSKIDSAASRYVYEPKAQIVQKKKTATEDTLEKFIELQDLLVDGMPKYKIDLIYITN